MQELLYETYDFFQFETGHKSVYDWNYLDLNIRIVENKLITKLYNKTVSFKFYVIRFSHSTQIRFLRLKNQ